MDRIKDIIAVELLFIFVFTGFLVVDSTGGFSSITGKATAQTVSQDTVLNQLQTALPKLTFLNDIQQMTMCLMVNMGQDNIYSFDIVKIGTDLTITSSPSQMCKGISNEDFIIYYLSYDLMKSQLIDKVPTFDELKSTGDGTNFYVYPSKQILPGGTLSDPVDFKNKFGAFLNKYFTPEEISRIMTSPQTRMALSFVSRTLYVIAGLVVLVVVIAGLILKFSKKPHVEENLELVAYIKSYLSQGYDMAQIKQALLDSGWREEDVNSAMQTASAEVTLPQDLV